MASMLRLRKPWLHDFCLSQLKPEPTKSIPASHSPQAEKRLMTGKDTDTSILWRSQLFTAPRTCQLTDFVHVSNLPESDDRDVECDLSDGSVFCRSYLSADSVRNQDGIFKGRSIYTQQGALICLRSFYFLLITHEKADSNVPDFHFRVIVTSYKIIGGEGSFPVNSPGYLTACPDISDSFRKLHEHMNSDCDQDVVFDAMDGIEALVEASPAETDIHFVVPKRHPAWKVIR